MIEKSSILFVLVTLSCLLTPTVGRATPLEEINPGSNIVAFASGTHLQAIMVALENFCTSLNPESLDKEENICREEKLFSLMSKIRKIVISETEKYYGIDFYISKEYGDLIKSAKSNYIEYSMNKKFEIIYVYKGGK